MRDELDGRMWVDHHEAFGQWVSDAVATVDAAYRRFHDICGMASTVGFTVTGRAAKELDAILVVAFRAQRGLTEAELTNARTGLDAVKAAANIEIPFFDQESSP